jgi:hypothetical protein
MQENLKKLKKIFKGKFVKILFIIYIYKKANNITIAGVPRSSI